MDTELRKAGYRLDAHTGVFKKPEFTGIHYSDGDDAERRIESIIQNASDLSTFSPELRVHCTDWVSTYHLSRSRSNILRPFNLSGEQKILEIGAGCGAITRYLGESGANILALEGSVRRSMITRSRTRDLPNVTVVAETFEDLHMDQQFDVITLIGVFEYASKYMASKNPHAAMLKRVISLLKPNGSIILAIENQLGLKYFAGVSEDHHQVPLYGIEDRYRNGEAKTFGQQSLLTMLKDAGLANVSFFAPYPDYKLPVSIVSESGFEYKEFDASAFAWQSAHHDLQLPSAENLTFAPEITWLPVFKEGLGLALSNSFLILASNEVSTCLDKNVIAHHYSTNRSEEYCKETLFKVDKAGQIVVTPTLLSHVRSGKVSESIVRFNLPGPKPYVLGTPLSMEFVRVVTRDDWAIDELGKFFKRYMSLLKPMLQELGVPENFSKKEDKLPGVFFDVIPQNIIIRNDGTPQFIDSEWELCEEIEIGMCIFRSVRLMLAELTRIGRHIDGRKFSQIDFVKEVSQSAGIVINDSDIHRYLALEAIIQEQLIGKPKESFLQWSGHNILDTHSLVTSTANLQKELDSSRQLANDRLQIIENISVSLSWRITEPLRNLGEWVKGSRNSTVFKLIQLWGVVVYLHRFVKFNYGYQALPIAVYRVAQREGLPGLKNRILAMVHDSLLSRFDERGQTHRNDYQEWIRRYDRNSEEVRTVIRSRMSTLIIRPIVSILMPVYDPDPTWLIACIESVKKQLYPHWELCIADDKSSNTEVLEILKQYSESDSRIKVAYRDQNGHISAASNTALDIATGEWVVLLDHDDELSDVALYRLVEAINTKPNVAMIYSDEDKIDESDRRHHPYFKCDWNLDLFYSQNMFSHLGAFKLDLIRQVGGFRIGFEGSQDYDLALRCIEKINPDQIHHLPYVLYHWRVHQESTALSNDSKPYAQIAAERALTEHFERRNIPVKIFTERSGYRVQYALPDESPLVTLVIPVRNQCELLKRCLESVFEKTTYSAYQIVVVDNGSDEIALLDYLEGLVLQKKIKVIRDDSPFNFSSLVNQGVELAEGDVVGLLNNDTEVITGEWMTEMVSHAIRTDVGAVGARLWYTDDTIQHGGLILGIGGVAGHSHKRLPKNRPGYFGRGDLISNVAAVTGACLFVRKELYKNVGGFNELDLGVAFNDVDFCCRLMELKYRNVWTPYANLYHHESASRGLDERSKRGERFSSEIDYIQKTWGHLLNSDPLYSPNLTLVHEDFSYAWPPRVEILGLN